MTTETKQKTKKVLGIVGNVVVWLFVAFSIFTTVLVFTAQGNRDGVPDIFGKSLITIQSNSMSPTYKKGDLVFMTKLSDKDRENLKKGDIITYRVDLDGDGKLELNTHRIDGFDEVGWIITKGDNEKTNATVDDYRTHPDAVVGKCTDNGKLAGVGNVIEFLGSSVGFFVCIVLPLILFFLYEMYNFISIVVSERAKRTPVSKETEEEIKKRAIEEYLKSQGTAAPADNDADGENKDENK